MADVPWIHMLYNSITVSLPLQMLCKTQMFTWLHVISVKELIETSAAEHRWSLFISCTSGYFPLTRTHMLSNCKSRHGYQSCKWMCSKSIMHGLLRLIKNYYKQKLTGFILWQEFLEGINLLSNWRARSILLSRSIQQHWFWHHGRNMEQDPIQTAQNEKSSPCKK